MAMPTDVTVTAAAAAAVEDVEANVKKAHFIKLTSLKECSFKKPDTLIEATVAVVQHCSEVVEVKTRQGDIRNKVDVIVCDCSCDDFLISIWGDMCYMVRQSLLIGNVILLQNLYLKEYLGRINGSLSNKSRIMNVYSCIADISLYPWPSDLDHNTRSLLISKANRFHDIASASNCYKDSDTKLMTCSDLSLRFQRVHLRAKILSAPVSMSHPRRLILSVSDGTIPTSLRIIVTGRASETWLSYLAISIGAVWEFRYMDVISDVDSVVNVSLQTSTKSELLSLNQNSVCAIALIDRTCTQCVRTFKSLLELYESGWSGVAELRHVYVSSLAFQLSNSVNDIFTWSSFNNSDSDINIIEKHVINFIGLTCGNSFCRRILTQRNNIFQPCRYCTDSVGVWRYKPIVISLYDNSISSHQSTISVNVNNEGSEMLFGGISASDLLAARINGTPFEEPNCILFIASMIAALVSGSGAGFFLRINVQTTCDENGHVKKRICNLIHASLEYDI